MIDFLLGIILFYIVFRLITSLIIPKITHYRINKMKEKFERENQEIINRKEKGYTQNIHPSLKKYYENKDKQ
jgi:uncharacterized membrane-anchored protein YhcB (DUF1043 family)